MSNELQTTNQNGNQVVAAPPKPRGDSRIENVKGLFATMAPKLAKVLPKHLTAERLVQISVACITRTPKLLEATPQSLMHAVMQCAETGLEPGSTLGEAYLVPFNRNVAPKGKPPQFITEVVFIPGYRGLVSLARRSGAVTDVESQLVREGDFFKYERGLELVLRHKPKPGATYDRPIVAAYMVAHLRGTKRPHVEVMWRDEIEAIRMRSQTGKKGEGPWASDYGEMARKTVVRRGMKMLPMSVAMLNSDDGRRFERGLAADDDDFEPEGATGFEPQGIDVGAESSEGLKGKTKRKALEVRATTMPAPVDGAIEEPFLPEEQHAQEEGPAVEPAPRQLTAEEREQEQAEAHFAAEEKRKAEHDAAAKAAADRAAFLRVPPPKKPAAAPTGFAAVPADEVKLSDFKLQSPTSGAAPVERAVGEDDDS